MVYEYMRCSEIVRRVSEEHPEPVLKKVTNVVPYPLFIQTMVMALFTIGRITCHDAIHFN